MKAFHAICGLPRSGSTLLCNVLNQNPDFYASSTSHLAQSVANEQALWSTTPEAKSDLVRDAEGTRERMREVMRAKIQAWHGTDKAVVFDKGRGWAQHSALLAKVYPESKLIITIRDPRAVFASIQKRHLATAELTEAVGETVFARANRMFAPQGLVGGPITQVEDMLTQRANNAVAFVFEKFVQQPDVELRKLYAELRIDWWSGHNFENVESTATDLDALYLLKYPHDGSGKVQPPSDHWSQHCPEHLASMILQRYPMYSKTFGYV